MEKLTFDEWKNSMAFLIDDNFDLGFLNSIEPIIEKINSSTELFSNSESLIEYLITDEPNCPSLLKMKSFIALIGLSEERLKRITSLVRNKFYGDEFSSEWSINKILERYKNDEIFRDLLTEFFLNGRKSEIGKHIPLYYLKNFRLNESSFLLDLKNHNYVERILNDSEIQGIYSNAIGAHVEKLLTSEILNYNSNTRKNIEFEIQKEFPLLNKNIDIIMPSVNAAKILIECSYNITTGSGQSKRADQLVSYYSKIMDHNANHRNNKIMMINFCDGYGWVGRQNDLHRIYVASDYVLNHKNINTISTILDQVF